jgi:hypothetical protein
MNNAVKLQLRSLAFDYDLNPDDLLNNVETESIEDDQE